MSELPPQFGRDENDPMSDAEDIRHRYNWDEIMLTVAHVDQLTKGIDSESDAVELSELSLNDIRHQIGDGYVDGLAAVEGYAYQVEFHEYDDLGIGQQRIRGGLQKMGTTEQPQRGRYEGCELHWVNDRWRVLLMVDVTDPSGDYDDGLYGFVLGENFLDNDGMIRDHIEQLYLSLDDEQDLSTVGSVVAQVGDDAIELVRHQDFIRSTASEQRAMLADVCDDAAATVVNYLGDDVAMTIQLQGAYHEIVTWLDSDELIKVNESAQSHELTSTELTGSYSGFTYVELRDTPQDKKLSRQDFSIGNGAPCLVLLADGVVQYIPAMQIQHLSRSVDAGGSGDIV